MAESLARCANLLNLGHYEGCARTRSRSSTGVVVNVRGLFLPFPDFETDDKTLAVENKTFRIERIREETARNSSIEITDKVTGSKQMMSVESYFARKHNLNLNYPDFPLVEVGRKGALYPMELCHMVYGQRYPYKLDRQQVCILVSVHKINELRDRVDYQYDQICCFETQWAQTGDQGESHPSRLETGSIPQQLRSEDRTKYVEDQGSGSKSTRSYV